MPNPSDHELCQEWLALLEKQGYRITGPRRAIVEALAHSPRALSPVALYDLGRRDHPQLGLVTVYRTLEKLEELGLIQRVHQTSGCHMVLRAPRGHQHLLLCTRCGLVETFDGDNLDGLIENTARRSGFKIEAHWLQLTGLCAACQQETPA